ncbi:rhodanese-like domain-containing protein [Stutzerimonas stutzeri]|uniref:rhodanese-like domain-containing protein n=1 Tax=Stutzerimonas stutzeri TaxID=316 RepID=UPI002109E162|nr:rhodanese-like domain-containing protein [Stutzerimonas stutzeri]MCQ4322463.1 rhodanese-like domain-containing protein [Stutzerimonas stutzeri]
MLVFEPVYTDGLAQISYLVGDSKAAVAAVIGGRSDSYQFDLRQASDGETIELGQVRLQVMHSPGHMPEHISLQLFDARQGNQSFALFTGDTLFNLDVGRPDLLGEGSERKLAGELYRTLFDHYLPLGDRKEIYPCQGAGSACGKSIGDRRHSAATSVSSTQPCASTKRRGIHRLAAGRHAGATPSLCAPEKTERASRRTDGRTFDSAISRAVRLRGTRRARRAGRRPPLDRKRNDSDVMLLDVRSPAEYEAGNIPAAHHAFVAHIDTALGNLDRDKTVATYCGSGYRASIAASILKKNGFKKVVNVPGSWAAWRAADVPVA